MKHHRGGQIILLVTSFPCVLWPSLCLFCGPWPWSCPREWPERRFCFFCLCCLFGREDFSFLLAAVSEHAFVRPSVRLAVVAERSEIGVENAD